MCGGALQKECVHLKLPFAAAGLPVSINRAALQPPGVPSLQCLLCAGRPVEALAPQHSPQHLPRVTPSDEGDDRCRASREGIRASREGKMWTRRT